MNQTIAIVTGASSGLGREYVRLLTQEMELHEIWAIARDQEKLDALRGEFGEKVRTFSLDLSTLDSIRTLDAVITAEQPQISILINSAGYAKLCAWSDLTVEESMDMIHLNCGGVVSMCLLCLPHMNRGGHILNIASQAAFQPLPYQNLYSSTKAFVRNYARALNMEVRDRGIIVTAVCPGWMDTNLFRRAEIGAAKATRRYCFMVSPDKVAIRSLEDARRGRDMSVYGGFVKCGHLLAKLLPQRAMMRMWLMQQGL